MTLVLIRTKFDGEEERIIVSVHSFCIKNYVFRSRRPAPLPYENTAVTTDYFARDTRAHLRPSNSISSRLFIVCTFDGKLSR